MLDWFKILRLFSRKPAALQQDTVTNETPEPLTPWWGTFNLVDNESRFWKVGNQVICLDRYNDEWHIAHCPADQFNPTIPARAVDLPFKTFVLRNQGNDITLSPTLPDRPVVSQLEHPLHIPAGEKITLYVSSPVWMKITTGKVPQILLDDIPTQTLSDTWFGLNTLEGELCYASKTRCSSRLEEFSTSSERIISPLLIKNRSKKTLILDQLSVPLPYLSVYTDSVNRLWTEQLIIHRDGDDDPSVKVAKGAPKAYTGTVTLLTEPRIDLKASTSLKHLFCILTGRSYIGHLHT
ncbi:MAG: hypothetical protein RLZ35_923 [Pseudomonadota bacterium]|jgi:hypothetical protein